MKDIVSTLQSRIAKRQNVIALFERERIYPSFLLEHAEQQKTYKRALAEIIRLRREVGALKREIDVISNGNSPYHRAEEI